MATLIGQSSFWRSRVLQRRCLLAALFFTPAFFLKPADLGFLWPSPGQWLNTLLVSIPLGFVSAAVARRAASRPQHLAQYPELRTSRWTRSLWWQSTLGWLLYDTAYEFMFRGFLFMNLLSERGALAAITLTVALYSAAHLPRGSREVLLCIPFGIFLCLTTWLTQSIWAAVIVHSALSVSNEFFSIRASNECLRSELKKQPQNTYTH
jgi:membrane protease YdiL (CAAX protease family)